MEDSENLVEDGGEDFGAAWDETSARRAAAPPRRRGAAKPMRQRIEEYFERKRLREALDEDVDDSIFS